MTAKYFAILTNQGAARLANAAALGTKLNLTQMAVGDANGTLPTPDPAQTKLINQKRIAPLNLLTVDPANTSQIIAEQIIPENEGGFWIREIGLYDDDGILIAVANCPETYKPQLQEGSGRTQTIRMILIVSSTSAITLKIDPAVVLATRQYVDDKIIEVKGYADDLMKKHVEAANPHKQYPLIANALKEMVDAGLAGDVLKNLGLGSGLTGVVGAAINALMSVTAPSATATFTADELIVETGTGTQYRLNAFSQAINLGTVGAGGMDTGTAPASGYLAIYALFNPTTGARCLIGVNATAAKVPEIYGGAYMPAGYTASALISVVATNASSLILPFSQIARTITIGSLSVFNTTTASASLVTVNIASAVPKNAKSVKLTGNTSTSGSSALFLNIYETSNAMGQNAFATTSTGLTYTTGYINLPVPQTIYANYGPAVTGFNQALLVSGYTF